MNSTTAIPARLSIDELCAKYGNEDAHANHVATLALKLFDATRVLFGIPSEDRPLLEAACRLHDVGYGIDPRRHAERGADLVLNEGLKGFGSAQRRSIAALIRLHPSPLKFEAARAKASRLGDSRRILYLAALLRIADGLDYAHLQDAVIVSVHEMKRRIRVGVRCGHFPQSVEVARRQSSLWRGAFPADMDFRLLSNGSSTRRMLLGPFLPGHEALRRLLFLNYRTMLMNVEGARAGSGSKALHDLRIAIRRMRTILSAFEKLLSRTSADRVNEDLQHLNRILGVARDLDVWIDFFSMESVTVQFTGHRLWAAFVAHQLEHRRLQQATVRRHLHGAGFIGLQNRIGRFLRIEIPKAAAARPAVPLETLARGAIEKSLRRIMKRARWRHARSTDKLHGLRIALRRMRYLGGFFGGVLGRPIRKLSRRAHAVEGMLGEIRDADLALDRIASEGPTPPRLLVEQLERLRQANTAALEAAWKRFSDPGLALEVSRLLKE